MTRQQISQKAAQRTGLDAEVVRKSLDAIVSVIADELTGGGSISIRGFATFSPKRRAAKTARNIGKGTTLIVPEHYAPAVKFSPELKERMKNAMTLPQGK